MFDLYDRENKKKSFKIDFSIHKFSIERKNSLILSLILILCKKF